MKIRVKNFGGYWEQLTCDCGGSDWEVAISDPEDGEAYECLACGEYTRYFLPENVQLDDTARKGDTCESQ